MCKLKNNDKGFEVKLPKNVKYSLVKILTFKPSYRRKISGSRIRVKGMGKHMKDYCTFNRMASVAVDALMTEIAAESISYVTGRGRAI